MRREERAEIVDHHARRNDRGIEAAGALASGQHVPHGHTMLAQHLEATLVRQCQELAPNSRPMIFQNALCGCA